MWTSSGPSAKRSQRPWRHMSASGSVVGDPEGAVDLDRAVEDVDEQLRRHDLDLGDLLAGGALAVRSIFQAACMVSSRAPSISIRDFAMKSWTNCFSASGPPKASRSIARVHMSSSARSAAPMARMQWWMRPGPRRAWAMAKPLALLAEEVRRRHAAALVADLAVAGPPRGP